MVHPLKILGISTTFSYPNSIGKILICNSPKANNDIVYRIPCGCEKYYIGQSGKCLQKRISQHKYSVATDQHCNAINCHTRSCNFPIKWSEAEIIYKNRNYIERNLIETACIHHTISNNFNTSTGLFKIDPLFLHIFNKQYKIYDKLS